MTTAPWTMRMYEALRDGQWHPVGEVMEQMCKEIDPGRASRENALTVGDTQARILAGKRKIAISVIRAALRKRRLETDRPPHELDSQIRLAGQLVRWDTARLSAHLNRPQTTVQSWFSNVEAIAEIQAQLPEGISAVYPHPFGGRAKTTPVEAIPAWERYAAGRKQLHRRRPRAAVDEAVIGAVGTALDLDGPAAGKATQRLTEELEAAGYAIYTLRT